MPSPFNFPPPEDPAKDLFTELEFRSLLREFGGEMTTVDRSGYRLVTNAKELEEMRSALAAGGRFAIDTETTSLDALRADLVGLSFCSDDTVAWYVPVGHTTGDRQLDWKTAKTVLAPLIESPDIGKTGQHLKYDLKVLARHGVELAGIDGDTLLADYLLSPDRRSHKLDDLALIHLNHKMISYSDAVGGQATLCRGPHRLRGRVRRRRRPRHLVARRETGAPDSNRKISETSTAGLELPLIPVLARMETNGIAVDRETLAGLSDELAEGITVAEGRCFEAAGQEFKIGSVKELARDSLRETRTAGHQMHQNRPLDRRAGSDRTLPPPSPAPGDPRLPVAGQTQKHLRGPAAGNDQSGNRPHPYSFLPDHRGHRPPRVLRPQSAEHPGSNPEGRRIRGAFVAPEGRVLLAADYSQIELRILAHLCGGIGGFADAFARGADVHAETAAGLFDIPSEEVTREMRTIAKAVNFGIVYGQSAFGLAQTQRISRSQAADYIKRYKERFPEIEDYRQRTLAEAAENGYVRPSWDAAGQFPTCRAGISRPAPPPSGWQSIPRFRAVPPISSKRPC